MQTEQQEFKQLRLTANNIPDGFSVSRYNARPEHLWHLPEEEVLFSSSDGESKLPPGIDPQSSCLHLFCRLDPAVNNFRPALSVTLPYKKPDFSSNFLPGLAFSFLPLPVRHSQTQANAGCPCSHGSHYSSRQPDL